MNVLIPPRRIGKSRYLQDMFMAHNDLSPCTEITRLDDGYAIYRFADGMGFVMSDFTMKGMSKGYPKMEVK